MTENRKVLITECADEKGLVSRITKVCFENNLNILSNNEFVDKENNRFFMRTELDGDFDEQLLLTELSAQLPEHALQRLVRLGKKRIAVMVTKEAHCLGELLVKSYYGALNAEIVAIVSNHNVLQELANKFEVPFYFIDHNSVDRVEHEEQLLECLAQYRFDYIILAKYMRVLTEKFLRQYRDQVINIHHSFLPAFVGAKPYHQAYQRGVKIIGATAHFVNEDLDQGPIINQDIAHVDHSYSPQDMARVGRGIEESVLTHAVHKVLEEKVIVYGNKTVVFD